MITLALVAGGYALADTLHLSGPIAIVVAGLLIGNHGRLLAMSDRTRSHLDTFWELVDEVLNVVLFVLIGLEVLVLGLDDDMGHRSGLRVDDDVAEYAEVPVGRVDRLPQAQLHRLLASRWGGRVVVLQPSTIAAAPS